MPETPDNSPEEKKKDETLDLIGKKPSRRERQRTEASKVKTVDDKKAEALDIFEDEGKKKKSRVRKTANSGKNIVPSISKKRDEEKRERDLLANPSSGDGGSEPPANDSVATGGSADDGDKPSIEGNVISLKPPVIVGELAEIMGLKPFEIMKDLIALEIFVAPTQAIEPEIAAKVCEAHGFVFEREQRVKGGGVHKEEEIVSEPEPEPEAPKDQLEYRAPIITFMGHVDHGKTSLLDYIRDSRVTAGEAGGITQHIGAYRVENDGHPITFLDTPGHAIFSAMRARGADITDIIVIVVAANDGIMPQTKEAIKHAKNSGKTIIVAINKIDLDTADPMRVKTQLMEHELVCTDLGGDIETVEVSATKGTGMQELIDLMALQAEVLELKANPNAVARAVIVEARTQAGKGPTATAIIQNGTLKVGQAFICGPFSGKVKGLINDLGKPIKKAGPATPVEILGFTELPHVGDELVGMESERATKKLSNERQSERRQERLQAPARTRLEDMMTLVQGDQKARLKLILKTDVQGSVGAIEGAIAEIVSDKVEVQFLRASAGSITESDIQMAASADAVILGFNVKVEGKAVRVAKSEGIQIKLYSVVYELIDQVRDAMLGLLEPETREKILGHAKVQQVFKVHKGKAAGCLVIDGKVNRKAHARVLRGKYPVFDGKMSTLRRIKDEVEEVKTGVECGIRLGQFNDYEEKDVIECYELEKIPQTL